MPKFIQLTPSGRNPYHTAYINCNAIKAVFTKGDGAHITFVGEDDTPLDVEESAKTVVARIELVGEAIYADAAQWA